MNAKYCDLNTGVMCVVKTVERSVQLRKDMISMEVKRQRFIQPQLAYMSRFFVR
jgi:hypothetical protein